MRRPLQRGQSSGDITTSQFAGTAITGYGDLVSKHFRQYPVLYIDLKVNWLVSVSNRGRSYQFKDVHGTTYEEMLILFDAMVLEIIGSLCNPYSDLGDDQFCMELRRDGALQPRRTNALMILTWELWRVYQKPVVVLIDEYDSPMHSAIEHGYAPLVRFFILLYCGYLMLFQANNFFAAVFGSLLKVCQRQRLRHCRLTSFDRAMMQCMQV
jgi:hypothetical protein